MTIPKIRTKSRVSPEIPLQQPPRSSLMLVTHPDHVCLALSIGHGNGNHRLMAVSLALPARDRLLTALLDWRYCADELPDDDTTVLLAREGHEVELAFHSGDYWWCAVKSCALGGDCYAWAHVPEPPSNPNRPKL